MNSLRKGEIKVMIATDVSARGIDIANVDYVLLQMAISELKNFSSIPVKVTINEYLEIAKEYSTPKSSIFINGILDKLVIELKEQGNLKKMGRGLTVTTTVSAQELLPRVEVAT